MLVFLQSDSINFITIGTILFLSLIGFIILFMLLHEKRMVRNMEEKQVLKSNFDQELLRSQLEIQETTFAHVGREIHDNIGQSLSVAKLYLSSLAQPNDEQQQKKLIETRELVGKAILDLRALSKSLNPEAIQGLGLENSIEQEIERLRLTGSFKVNYSNEGTSTILDPKTEVMLFRMCQEILSNALRHSSATELSVALKWKPQFLSIQIKDNGIGFYPDDKYEGGQGIQNLRKRAELIDADIKIKSEITKGTDTHISLNIPIKNQIPKPL